ncbi:MAG: TIGR00266 family protein [Anaerolineales bacterium]|nr:TIGR00266 family protein [Anaerolineales bacterium]MCS7246625.1 TIGR00266 family protein [Anaerolineales bacterium]MDW8160435.1 TIGR00266 family protein [Anaerolineales bacterium]MDW8447782.1 TIGR00266 family protein [Anaerolineales bacterium]
MADVIEYKIYGEELQLVEVILDPGEGVQAETGTMTYMENGIQMQTTTGGGIFKGLKRMLTGESFFVTTFYNSDAKPRCVAFAAPYPGSIIPFDLDQFRGEVLCQKDSFLAAAQGVDIDIAFTRKIGAGLFGGEGFILQRLKGDGMVFVHAGGTVIEKELAAGETLRVDTGCIVAFAATVDYDIQFVGGFKNALFGGEGLFLARLTGPGKVYLQSLPFSRLVDRIKRGLSLSAGGDEQSGIAGLGGDLLKGLISGR